MGAAAAPFAPRGTLEITPSAPRHKMVKFAPARVELAPNASAVGALLASDGFYRLRARSLGGAGPWASASLRACDLALAVRAPHREAALKAAESLRGPDCPSHNLDEAGENPRYGWSVG